MRAQEARKKTMREAGKDGKRVLLAAGAAPTGGDLKFSGAGRKKLGVTLSFKQGRTTDVLVLKPAKGTAGMWAWANTGTKAGRRVWRGSRRGAMNHPGTKGRMVWTKTADKILPEMVERLRESLTVSVGR